MNHFLRKSNRLLSFIAQFCELLHLCDQFKILKFTCSLSHAGLKFLVRLCTDLGLKDAQEYIQKLKKAEKARETKQQVTSI